MDISMGIVQNGSQAPQEAEDELLVNGKSITSQVTGYKQLTVEGRGLMPYSLDTVKYLNRAGERVTGVTTDPKDLTIKCRITAKSASDLRDKVDSITRILAGELVIGFKDDSAYVYEEVYITGSSFPEETSNVWIGTFTLTAFNPNRVARGSTTSKVVTIDDEFVPIDVLRVDFKDTLDRPVIKIDNGIYETEFRLVGTVESGSVVTVSVDKSGRVNVTGSEVELSTLPREFVVFNGATGRVEGSVTSEVTFTYRGRKR